MVLVGHAIVNMPKEHLSLYDFQSTEYLRYAMKDMQSQQKNTNLRFKACEFVE